LGWPWLIYWQKFVIELKILFNCWRRFGIYNPLLMPKLCAFDCKKYYTKTNMNFL
jgi:hypothetical protein